MLSNNIFRAKLILLGMLCLFQAVHLLPVGSGDDTEDAGDGSSSDGTILGSVTSWFSGDDVEGDGQGDDQTSAPDSVDSNRDVRGINIVISNLKSGGVNLADAFNDHENVKDATENKNEIEHHADHIAGGGEGNDHSVGSDNANYVIMNNVQTDEDLGPKDPVKGKGPPKPPHHHHHDYPYHHHDDHHHHTTKKPHHHHDDHHHHHDDHHHHTTKKPHHHHDDHHHHTKPHHHPSTPLPFLILSGGKITVGEGEWKREEIVDTVELIELDGHKRQCLLPELPTPIFDHTQNDLLVCGGNEDTYCRKFFQGPKKWLRTHYLSRERKGHSSWQSPNGLVLMGGESEESRNTSEILFKKRTKESFGLKYPSQYSCVVDEPEAGTFLLITGAIPRGGLKPESYVSRYNSAGWVEDLDSLQVPRYDHGCTRYKNKHGKMTSIVCGGVGGGRDCEENVFGQSKWNLAKPLPAHFAGLGLRGFTFGNRVLMIGGSGVIELDFVSWKWKKLDVTLKQKRTLFGVSSSEDKSLFHHCQKVTTPSPITIAPITTTTVDFSSPQTFTLDVGKYSWSQETWFLRTALVKVPAVPGGSSVPVVVYLGLGEEDEDEILDYLKNDCILVFAQAYKDIWNVYVEESKADDIQYILDLVKKLKERIPAADMSNVNLVGVRNAASFVNQFIISTGAKNPFRRGFPFGASLIEPQYNNETFWKFELSADPDEPNEFFKKVQPVLDPKFQYVYFHGTNANMYKYSGQKKGPDFILNRKVWSAQESALFWARAMGYNGDQIPHNAGQKVTGVNTFQFKYLRGRVRHYKMSLETDDTTYPDHPVAKMVLKKLILEVGVLRKGVPSPAP